MSYKPAGDWRDTTPFYFLSESADGKSGFGPLVVANFGRKANFAFGVSHVVKQFAGPNSALCAGTLGGGLAEPGAWLPQFNCASNRYPIARWTDKDDMAWVELVRDATHGVTEISPLQVPGDLVTWYSIARGEWQYASVVDFTPTGVLTLVGTLAESGDSGAPVFTWRTKDEVEGGKHYSQGGTAGRYVGSVSASATSFNGNKVNAAKCVTIQNPRIQDYVPPADHVPGKDPIIIGSNPVTHEIPRLPISLIAVDGYAVGIAEPDRSVWILEPSTGKWTAADKLPPIVETATPTAGTG